MRRPALAQLCFGRKFLDPLIGPPILDDVSDIQLLCVLLLNKRHIVISLDGWHHQELFSASKLMRNLSSTDSYSRSVEGSMILVEEEVFEEEVS